MTKADASDPRIQALIHDLAEMLDVEPHIIDPDARLVEDLGLDSIALTELVVLLILDYGADDLGRNLEYERWAGRTVKEIATEFCVHLDKKELRSPGPATSETSGEL